MKDVKKVSLELTIETIAQISEEQAEQIEGGADTNVSCNYTSCNTVTKTDQQ